jgi:hypothetical protein
MKIHPGALWMYDTRVTLRYFWRDKSRPLPALPRQDVAGLPTG